MKTKIDIIPVIQCELSPEQIRILIQDGWPARMPWIFSVADWLSEVDNLSSKARIYMGKAISDVGAMIASHPKVDKIILC